MDRQIVCFAIPSVELALAQLNDARVRTWPVAFAPVNTARALIREVSSEATRAGLAVGMSVDRARRICPSLQVLAPNPSRVRNADESLLGVIARYAPVWELSQPGSFLMDVTGTGRLFGPAYDVAANVQQEVLEQHRLDGVAGVGSNKLIAQTAATLIEPSELYDVRPGSEEVFMSPLPLGPCRGLQRVCMRKVVHLLDDLNLCTLGDLAGSPLDALEVAFGDYAGSLSRVGAGNRLRAGAPPSVQPTLEETVLFEPDEIDDPVLIGRSLDALQRLCRTLRSQRRVCGRLALSIRYTDQIEVTRQERIQPETCWEHDLSPVAVSLFHKCMRRRIRLMALTLSMSGLTVHAEQGLLFEERAPYHRQRERAQKLAVALDTLKARCGERAIRYGRS